MRPIVIANFEYVGAERFIVTLLYDGSDELLDTVILPCETPVEATIIIRRLAERYSIASPVVWTSDTALYGEMLSKPGYAGAIKHKSDTSITRRVIEQESEILRELYGIEAPAAEPKPVLPKWRSWMLRPLRKLVTKLEGDGRYEI
ncbi:hypothetical protein FE782_03725 [Paenibacillus antri]|uniref:Uncharacterized protein n=1 Tax=Paenibacillus antri TaxID=2582848 RepID=A0A5R9GCB1_9BACL|nr:hypothetical protein [Paenibacillus antri]TLS53391.1 hypothetical protein FE782_03725 [Paenibacillus antri]